MYLAYHQAKVPTQKPMNPAMTAPTTGLKFPRFADRGYFFRSLGLIVVGTNPWGGFGVMTRRIEVVLTRPFGRVITEGAKEVDGGPVV